MKAIKTPDHVRFVQEISTIPATSAEATPVVNHACWWIEILESASNLEGVVQKVLARSVQGYCTQKEAAASINEMILNISDNDELNFADIQPIPRLYDDLEADALLPLIGDCADPARQLPPDLSDPYSFRATVVLPYWPARFQQSEFRSFLETTLRQQAPAHVFLRICWVNACQMREFEAAFRRWLRTKAAGEGSCDASASLNALIRILFQLRNVYPAGTLHDCSDTDPNANQIVLNYSIIGSANSNSHGNQ